MENSGKMKPKKGGHPASGFRHKIVETVDPLELETHFSRTI